MATEDNAAVKRQLNQMVSSKSTEISNCNKIKQKLGREKRICSNTGTNGRSSIKSILIPKQQKRLSLRMYLKEKWQIN